LERALIGEGVDWRVKVERSEVLKDLSVCVGGSELSITVLKKKGNSSDAFIISGPSFLLGVMLRGRSFIT